ncbi:MAG TPA: hypothetical protein VHK22_07855 [Gaiellaceae bacterium]|nr:hypothetical protein [Gaiellaceae bacterium]
MRALALLPVLAAALVLAPTAWAPAPAKGVFVPGESLGGVELRMTKAEVRELWGSRFGVCRNCEHPTWYFNLKPFEPHGAGVEFRRDRVARAFTLWRPLGWRTAEGLELGVQLDGLEDAVPGLAVRPCEGYAAYVDEGRRATSVYYVFRGRLWGFALMSPPVSPCL